MKVFLSWSGTESEYMAESFKEWLPNILQYIEPYMSKKDITLGERWGKNIEENLRSHDYGLAFITPNNIESSWINFEAGALSKNLGSNLVPILCHTEITLLNKSPLTQFQAAKELDKDSICDLINEMNLAAEERHRISSERIEKAFEKWWPDLEDKLKNAPNFNENKKDKRDEVTQKELLYHLLDQVKENSLAIRQQNKRIPYKPYRVNPKLINRVEHAIEIMPYIGDRENYIVNNLDRIDGEFFRVGMEEIKEITETLQEVLITLKRLG